MVANAIRMHQSRCTKASPPRKPLLVKYQLAGSTAEAVLEPALHPNAFDGPTRPKGPVWYLSNEIGKAKWRNPFQGITVPKAPPRKPAAPRPKQTKPTRKEREEAAKAARKDKRTGGRESKAASSSAATTPASTPAPDATAPLPRIKLRVTNGDGGTTTGAEDSDSPEPSSRATSQSRATTPMPITPPHPTVGRRRRPHKKADVLDDSDESESSDSEGEDSVAPLRAPRRIVLPQAAMAAGTRFPPTPARATMSPFGELFFSPVNTASLPLPAVQQSPFPSHSLDNTIWGARRSVDTEPQALEASSSSDEDADWGTSSGLMVKADEPEVPTIVQDEDPKLKAATNAMRELFPYQEGSTPVDIPALNQLDNHISDTSSAADSSSTATAALYQGKLKSTVCPASLPPWIISSPTSSPNLANRPLPQVETSPIQFLSRTANDIADRSMDMDVDMADNDESWLDESGQLPVHAEDSFSDVDVGSCFGDINSPERDRHLQTAEWARDSALHIKQEPEDCYPSPAATEEAIATPDSSYTVDSRESTVSSQSVSSELSELSDAPYELDGDDDSFWLLGPESVKMEELDDWLPSCKTDRSVHRGRARASRYDSSRCSGSWGGIGVNNPFVPFAIPAVASKSGAAPPMVRKRSLRSHSRRTRSTPRKSESRLTPAPTPEVVVIEPSLPQEEEKVEAIEIEPEIEDDAIGTDELERAREEAEACEKQKREEAEKSREALNACRRAFAAADAAAGSGSVSPDDVSTPAVATWPDNQPSPWNEVGTMLGSSDELSGLARSGTLSPLALQHTPAMLVDSFMVSLDPKALHLQSSPTNAELMMLDNALSQAEIEAASEGLPKPVPVSSTSPSAAKSAPTPASAPTPSVPSSAPTPARPADAPAPTAPAPAQAASAPTGRSPPRKIAPIAPAPASHPVPIAPKSKEPVKLAPAKPASAEKPAVAQAGAALAKAPVAQRPNTVAAPAPAAPASVAKSATPSTASSSVPTRTVSPVNRTATVSPAVSTTSASSGSSANTASTTSSGNTSSSSGSTTKRLLPGIDACVVDNLPCYSHIWEAPKGGKCTVLRRLDTDFVNGTALLTALGVSPAQQTEHLNSPSPTLASHRAVPLISPQGLHHAPGVPGVWIPLIEARALAKKCGLQDPSLLANILREDLFQLFKKLAGISLRHTSSTESFGMPFVTQPNPRQQGARTQAQLQAQRQAAAAQAAKGPLVRGPGAPPDGCPEPKRRRSVVGGTTPVAVPVRPPPSSAASTSSASSGTSTPAGARMPARMVAQPASVPAGARPVAPVAVKPATPAAPAMHPTPATKAPPAATTTPVVAAIPAAQPTSRRTRASVSAK